MLRARCCTATSMVTTRPEIARNVLGTDLKPCSTDPLAGFFRDGCCNTANEDLGAHTVCVEVTREFLAYSKDAGNDLLTPHPELAFPGLKPGDRWCLCASRWVEALEEGKAPRVVLESTHERTLEFIDLATLKRYAIPG
jgi:hypothetical protein